MNELVNNLEAFADKNIQEQQAMLSAILRKANSDPEKFRQEMIRGGFNKPDQLRIIYEALSKDPETWSHFFLEETERILNAARKSETPEKILKLLTEFSFINPDHFFYREKLVEILNNELDNKVPVFRYYAISMLHDFVESNDYDTIARMKQLLKDPEWRIRYWTFFILKDLNLLDNLEKLSLTDRIKARLSDTLNFK